MPFMNFGMTIHKTKHGTVTMVDRQRFMSTPQRSPEFCGNLHEPIAAPRPVARTIFTCFNKIKAIAGSFICMNFF